MNLLRDIEAALRPASQAAPPPPGPPQFDARDTLRQPGLLDRLNARARAQGRPAWPEDWIARRDPGDAARMQTLWVHVFAGVLRDIVRDVIADYRRGSVGQPLPWVGTRDFRVVASLAGLDPHATDGGAERLHAALAMNDSRAGGSRGPRKQSDDTGEE